MTLLLILLPILALLLIVPLSGRSFLCRRIAVGTTVLQLVFIVAAIALFPSEEDILQGERIGVAAIPAQRLTLSLGSIDAGPVSYALSMFLGVDAIGLALLLVVPLAFSATLAFPSDPDATSSRRLVLLLLLNACVTGVIVSHDGLLLVLFFGAAMTGVAALVGLDAAERGGAAARRFLPVGYGATLVLAGVLLGLSANMNGKAERDRHRHSFDLPALADQALQEFNGSVFDEEPERPVSIESSGGLQFLPLLLLCGLFMMVFPLHPFCGDLVEATAPPVSTLLLVLFPVIGLYLLFRFPFDLLPELVADSFWRGAAAPVSAFTAVYAAVVALGERQPKRILRFLVMGWTGLSLLVVLALEPAWIGPAVGGHIVSLLCIIGLSLLIGRLRVGAEAEGMEDVRGLRNVIPRWSLLFGAPTALLAVLPLAIGAWLLFGSVDSSLPPELADRQTGSSSGFAIPGIIGGVLLGIAACRMGWRLLAGEFPLALRSATPIDMDRGSTVRWLFGGLVVAGVALFAILFLQEHAGDMIEEIVRRRTTIPT